MSFSYTCVEIDATYIVHIVQDQQYAETAEQNSQHSIRKRYSTRYFNINWDAYSHKEWVWVASLLLLYLHFSVYFPFVGCLFTGQHFMYVFVLEYSTILSSYVWDLGPVESCRYTFVSISFVANANRKDYISNSVHQTV